MSDSLPPEALALASRLFTGAREGDIALLRAALSRGLPPNMTNDKGDSLVMLAAYHGHPALVEYLIDAGADPNRMNDRGQTPLGGAVFKAEEVVIEVLLKGGADPDWGTPSAMACIEIFKQDKWRTKFEGAPGRGKAVDAEEWTRRMKAQ